MTIPVTIVCMLLVSASVCQQTGPEQTQYLNQLVGIQSRLLGQVDELLSLVQQVNTNVSVVRGYAGLEQSALEAGIVLQRGKILSMQLPTSTMCNQMAEEQKKQLLGRIAQTQVNLKTITNKLKMQPSCPRNQQISLQAGLLTRYLTSTKSSISNTCKSTPTSTPAKTVLIPYANNSYYIYGAQTQQNYQANLQNLLKQGYIQQQCPAESPFPKGNQCASCPADRVHYYDLTLLRCLTCPQSYVYVPGKHICIQQVNMTSPQVINYVGEMPAPEGEQPVQYCPVERPYYDGRQCVACGLPGYFDMSAHRCLSCPEGQSFDLKNKKCGRVSYNSNINQKSINYCCGQMPHQPNIQSCPAQSPFYDGTNCIACPLPKYFNLQTLSCVLCPEGEQFSTRQRKCMSNKYKQLVYVSNINENVTNYQGNPANTDQYQLVGTCPKDRPFSTLNECIACEQPYFFNFQALQCQNCPSQTAFDKRIHKCLPTTTVTAIQKYNTNTQAIRDYIGAQPQYDSQLPMCPSEHPLFDGSQCVTCPPNFHVDYDRLKCVGCPSGYIFSPAGHQCLAGSPLYYTDLSSNRIYYHPGDYESMLTLIQKQRAEIPGIRACPPEKPFFDQANRLCIDCPAEFPYFDVKYNRCIDCGKGSRFDESIGGCRGH